MLAEEIYPGYLTGEPILTLLARQQALKIQRLEKVQIRILRQIEDAILTRTLWNLYRGSRLIKILERSAAQRQTLTRREFKDILLDVKVMKVVVYDNQIPVGIVFTTNDLTALLNYGAGKWQSPDFYSQRFDEDLTSGKVYFLLPGGFSQDLVSSFWAEDILDSIWKEIVDELKIQDGKFLVYDYSQIVAHLIESPVASIQRLSRFGQLGSPSFLGAEVYRRFRWPASVEGPVDYLRFSIKREARGASQRVFGWLEEDGLVENITQEIDLQFRFVPYESMTPTLIDEIYGVARVAFGGIQDHPNPEHQLFHNQRSPHRQMETQEEFLKDLVDPNCRVFVGKICGKTVFYCLFRVGLDERGESLLGEGGLTCLNYKPLRQHLNQWFLEDRVCFILSIGFAPKSQGILGNRASLKTMTWMLDQVLPRGGMVGFDFAERINPSMKTLHRWLGLAKSRPWGLPLLSEVCDRQIYEVIEL